jgi:hypothetical protein
MNCILYYHVGPCLMTPFAAGTPPAVCASTGAGCVCGAGRGAGAGGPAGASGGAGEHVVCVM